MFLKKICLLVLIATSITPSIEAHSTIDDSRLWKKLSTLKTKELPHTTIKKTSIPNLGKENIKILAENPLQIQIQTPQFLREGDRIELSAKIINQSDQELTGTTQLSLLNAVSNQSVDGWFKNVFPTQYFTVAAGQILELKFPIEIPYNFNSALKYILTATTLPPKLSKEAISKKESTDSLHTTDKNSLKSKENIAPIFSDSKESTIPIVTNRILITESLPFNSSKSEETKFMFKKLLQSEQNTAIKNQGVTVEYADNPSWYVVQALPYLMEPVFESTEQIFNQYYANVLAMHINRREPSLKETFSKWQTENVENQDNKTKSELVSNLQNNKALRGAIFEETPWVMDAIEESAQKKKIATRFDSTKIFNDIENSIEQLIALQRYNGAFSWFKGGPEDRELTQYIIAGIGQLIKLNTIENFEKQNIKRIVDKAIPYLDKKILEKYNRIAKNKVLIAKNNLEEATIHYLYLRSFYQDYAFVDSIKKAQHYFLGEAKKYWPALAKNSQAMIAIALNRSNEQATAKSIIQSLKQSATNSKELGRYWKELTTSGYSLSRSPVENQSIMIAAFSTMDQDVKTINELKLWLLQQKLIHHWNTTKATAAACYALLLGNQKEMPNDLLPYHNKEITISLGGKKIGGLNVKSRPIADPSNANKMLAENQTGYFKYSIESEKVNPSMGNIYITVNPGETKFDTYQGWGAVYWQYFDDLNKTKNNGSPFKLTKQLFVEKKSDKGILLLPIKEVATLQVGDKIKVRLQIQVNQDIAYLQIKDQRAACLIPLETKNRYQLKGGWVYYQRNGEVSTQFFIDRLSKGTYFIEYEQLVIHPGNFSNGLSSIETMYSPAFASYSDEIRLVVENQK